MRGGCFGINPSLSFGHFLYNFVLCGPRWGLGAGRVSRGVSARRPAANPNPSHRDWLARRDIRNHFNFMILFLLFYIGFPMKNDRIIKLEIW